MQLQNKKILLGITGSIAAYKAAYLTRLLVKEGAIVKIVITPYAKEFITPVTLATLSKNTVLCDFFKHDDGAWNSHVELGCWADVFLIAPCTASTIAKMAHGVCDNLLLTTYLSMRCPVIIAPAMDLDMFSHPATKANMKILESYGNMFIEPASGELASGLVGKGRMEEPEEIVKKLISFFSDSEKKTLLKNKKILITAGPTVEAIDPVRFISNHSSGKMGYALAEAFAQSGAEVVLVSGPVALKVSNNNINVISVVSAHEMYEAVISRISNADVIVMAAAVADYTPVAVFDEKQKSNSSGMQIELKPTIDIAKKVGELKRENQITVGFALETQNETTNAIEKIKKKNFDFIVLNSLRDAGAGFGFDTNKISIISKTHEVKNFDLKPKNQVANDIVNEVVQYLNL
ncbi:MAG: bifunctional phosphopantothenoylcysteine decarboxylase/phosphopantothenate--cysteine ligase CoaBC [Bacteroidales bacterium]|nr:bifunctional phosphopantothenoylcysteine decarboxylase/phosphopantothenate--cysteine ligase CoaBC [Bacteroidales bacterium]